MIFTVAKGLFVGGCPYTIFSLLSLGLTSGLSLLFTSEETEAQFRGDCTESRHSGDKCGLSA